MNYDNNTIMIRDAKGVSILAINSIVRVEAVNNYSKIFLTDGRHVMVSKVLRLMEAMLAGKGFDRVHRSHLVNTAYIQRYNLYQLNITLHNGEAIVISRRRRTGIRKKLAERRAAFLNEQKIAVAA